MQLPFPAPAINLAGRAVPMFSSTLDEERSASFFDERADASLKEVSRCKEVVTKTAFRHQSVDRTACVRSSCPVIGLELRVFFVFPLPDSLWGHLIFPCGDSTQPWHPHIIDCGMEKSPVMVSFGGNCQCQSGGPGDSDGKNMMAPSVYSRTIMVTVTKT